MKKLKSPPNSAALSRRRKVCGRRRRSHPSNKKKTPAAMLSLSLSLKKQNAAVPMPHANFLVHHSF
jgi:hypothetical protein